MKNNAIHIIAGGIKCDNSKCNYADMTVKVEDYKNWVNKPCPDCGHNLLTEADYKAVLNIINLANSINKKYGNVEFPSDGKQHGLLFHMNGTGNVEMEDYEIE